MNAKGNPDGSLSHYPSLRILRLGWFFDKLTRPAAIAAGRFIIKPQIKKVTVSAPAIIEVGSGNINFKDIIPLAEKCGVKERA